MKKAKLMKNALFIEQNTPIEWAKCRIPYVLFFAYSITTFIQSFQ
jgi:hypothetical protein